MNFDSGREAGYSTPAPTSWRGWFAPYHHLQLGSTHPWQ